MAAEHAKLPLIPPYLQPRDYDSYCGANFASAGAGVLPETFQGAVCVFLNLMQKAIFVVRVKMKILNNI